MKLKYYHIDVFSDKKFGGNPAAVFYDCEELQDGIMQKIAAELNLSETVFIQKSENQKADYKAKIFTPQKELPFAGHPTIAAASVFKNLFAQEKTKFIQDCGTGLIEINEKDSIFFVKQNDPIFRDIDLTKQQISEIFSLELSDISSHQAQIISTGIPWLTIELNDEKALKKATPDHKKIIEISQIEEIVGAQIFTKINQEQKSSAEIKVRTFAPIYGVYEDPACGSGNGCVASFIAKYDVLSKNHYQASQGEEVKRPSQIFASFEKIGQKVQNIMIGGRVVKMIEGIIEF